MSVVGGFGDVKPADDTVSSLLGDAAVRSKIAETTGEISSLEVKGYKTQVVAGTNFLVHAVVNGRDYTVKVFRPLPHTGAAAEVRSVEEGAHL